MNPVDIADALFGGLADYGDILALVSNSVIASASCRSRVPLPPSSSASTS
jgi:hypothetical protein